MQNRHETRIALRDQFCIFMANRKDPQPRYGQLRKSTKAAKLDSSRVLLAALRKSTKVLAALRKSTKVLVASRSQVEQKKFIKNSST